tara:strand:- start:475 stop:1683 length:1209 start_codon:yes stop_codon:yes gene_type:complete
MAITGVTIPVQPVLAYTPTVYSLSSDDVNIVSLIIEIHNTATTRIAAFSVQPDLGTTDEFTFDIQEVLKDNVSFILKTLGASAVINDVDNMQYVVRAFEVTEVDGLLVTNYDPDDDNNSSFDYQSATGSAFNWRESHMSLASFDKTDYELISDTSLFLTGSPNPKTIELGQNEFLGMAWSTIVGMASKNFSFEILTFDAAGSTLSTDTLAVTDWNTFPVNYLIDPYLDAPVGTANLIAQGISLTNVASYTIQLQSDDGDRSEIRTFNIVEGCPTDVRIHFVNRFGKQDSITLKGNQIEGLTGKATTYQKSLGLTYDSSAFGRAVVQNINTNTYTAYSKSIGREELEFANSMLISKMAYMEVDSNYFSILIEDGSKIVRNESNMPIQFRLDFSLANQEKGHKG